MNKVLLTFILILIVLFSYKVTYEYGKHVSYTAVHSEWSQEKIAIANKIRGLEEEYRINEAAYRTEIQKLVDNLTIAQADFNDQLARLRADYTVRLRTSEERTSIYKRMSEAGDSERRNLADHAAQLDRSLEEGRSLVRELGATLRQRELELGILGSQIQADRNLLDKADEINE